MIAKLRICKECGFIGLEGNFRIDGHTRITNTCKPCDALRSKLYRQNNKEKCKKANASWRLKNKTRKQAAYRVWQLANMDKVRAINTKCKYKRYGITSERFEKMLVDQDNKCAICRTEFNNSKRYTTPHIDHDHSCCPTNLRCCGKCVRALLCGPCNQFLGRIKDNITIADNIGYYLRKHANSRTI